MDSCLLIKGEVSKIILDEMYLKSREATVYSRAVSFHVGLHAVPIVAQLIKKVRM